MPSTVLFNLRLVLEQIVFTNIFCHQGLPCHVSEIILICHQWCVYSTKSAICSFVCLYISFYICSRPTCLFLSFPPHLHPSTFLHWEIISWTSQHVQCIFRKPKECKERHKVLMDRSGDGADSADDSGSSQSYPSTLPGIPKVLSLPQS